MIFAIFALSLACSMLFCPMQASAQAHVSETAQSEVLPCHAENEASEDCPFMTNMDCLGIDMFQADNNSNLSNKASFSSLDFSWAYLTLDSDILRNNVNTIRGSPFDSRLPYIDGHDLYLTTQRLRI